MSSSELEMNHAVTCVADRASMPPYEAQFKVILFLFMLWF